MEYSKVIYDAVEKGLEPFLPQIIEEIVRKRMETQKRVLKPIHNKTANKTNESPYPKKWKGVSKEQLVFVCREMGSATAVARFYKTTPAAVYAKARWAGVKFRNGSTKTATTSSENTTDNNVQQ